MGNIYSQGIANYYKNNIEIQSLINQLKDESSDHLSILKNLRTFLETVQDEEYLGKTFLEMGFLESVAKIFENKKDCDENIVNLAVIIINKIDYKYFDMHRKNNLKVKDAIDPLYSIMIRYSQTVVRNHAIKLIAIMAKKHPSDLMNSNRIKECYKIILPSNEEYSLENKRSIFLLFKEILEREIIKKGEYGSEIIEELIYIVDESERRNNLFNTIKYQINEDKDFVQIAKEKGFKGNLWKNKNEIVADFLFIDWKELCKEDKKNKSDDSEEGILKDEEKEKIKKFYERFLSHPFDVYIRFIYRLYNILCYNNTYSDDYDFFKGEKNCYFLYLFLPLVIKNYQFEEIFPEFLKLMHNCYYLSKPCCYYLNKLCQEIKNRLWKKQKEEREISEEIVATLMFLWNANFINEYGKEVIYWLISLSVKVFEWLGRIDKEKEEEIKDKEKVLLKEEYETLDEEKKVMNKKEMIMYKLVDIIRETLYCRGGDLEREVWKDGRMGKVLLEIVKNHLKNERDLIEKGNKKRIIEYVVYSFDYYYQTSIPIAVSCYSFPFSNKTIVFILENIEFFLYYDDYEKIKKKDILIDIIELLNNYIDLINMINGCDAKKEIEKALCQECSKEIINHLNEKIYLSSECVESISSLILYFVDISTFDDEINRRIKRLITLVFSHSNFFVYINDIQKEKSDGEMKEMILVNLFTLEEYSRKYLTRYFISSLTSKYCYSIIDYYNLAKKSDEGCDIIGILMKELSGEIVDRIKKKERRRYERERMDYIYFFIIRSVECLWKYTFEDRNNIYLGFWKRRDSYDGKEEEVKEAYNYISDVLEEEDTRECLILFLKHLKEDDYCSFEKDSKLSDLSMFSNNALSYFFCSLVKIEATF